jgi:hypothetical protein
MEKLKHTLQPSAFVAPTAELELCAHDPDQRPAPLRVHDRVSVRPFQFHHLRSSGCGFVVRAA